MKAKKKVSIVLCCYNEETNIPFVVEAIHQYVDNLNYDFEIILVNDGSSDTSIDVMKKLSETDPTVFYIDFSRNFGHQNALKAGLDYATGDCIISMDADMQHPPRMLPQFLEKWEEGYEVVYTRRVEDKKLPFLKRKTSTWFYKVMNWMSDIELENGVADFRLMDRKAANAIIGIKDGNLFVRGLVQWIGFKQFAIDYIPDKRLSGTTKYSFKKMMSMAVQGILSFSTKPLYFALYIGFAIAVLSLLCMPYAFFSYYVWGHTTAGWTSLICLIGFLGGLQLFILGIIGLYIGRIFIKSKGYPAYIVRDTNVRQNS